MEPREFGPGLAGGEVLELAIVLKRNMCFFQSGRISKETVDMEDFVGELKCRAERENVMGCCEANV